MWSNVQDRHLASQNRYEIIGTKPTLSQFYAFALISTCYYSILLPLVPSGEATNPLKRQLPSSSLQAYPAMGVLQDPSSVNRKALSHATANLVSSWFNFAM